MTVRTRFAPSPTGMLHIGGVRTALFCYLYAKRHHGTYILRVEDTDRERSTPQAVEVILDGLKWLGLTSDEGPYYQTQRYDRYTAVIQQLIESRHAYHCHCTKERLDEMRNEQIARKEKPRYDGRCRELGLPPSPGGSVVRFKNPTDGQVVVSDLVHGPIVFDNRELDDLIILRSDGNPTYNFCVAVDDWDMQITHVIRGDDHINNTPRQINLLQAMGGTPPHYAHLPMILGPDGQKLSKRHGAVSVLEYREAGFLPEALLNYLGRLGWSHGDQEIFTLNEMAALFDLKHVNKSAAALSPDKMLWTNQQHLMKLSASQLAAQLQARLTEEGVEMGALPIGLIAESLRERAKTLKEMADGARFYFVRPTHWDPKDVQKHLTAEAHSLLQKWIERLSDVRQSGEWNAVSVHAALKAFCEEQSVGLGKLAQPLRVALSGGTVSPPIDQVLVILGVDEVKARVQAAFEACLS